MEIPYTVAPREDTGLWNAKLGIWLFLASEVMLFGGLFSSYVFLRTGATAGVPWPEKGTLLNIPIGMFNTFVLIISSITIVMAWASLKMRNLKNYKLYMGATILLGLAFLVVKLSVEYPQKFRHYGITLKDTGKTMTGHLENKADVLDDSKDSIMFLPDDEKAEHKTGLWSSIMALFSKEKHGEPVKIEKSNIDRLANFGPWYSPFFAIYFTLTALHGLHVLGGTLVNAYFLGPGVKMFATEPEHFTNRIEVAGLFWHFVDLVWIFLFPVFYLL